MEKKTEPRTFITRNVCRALANSGATREFRFSQLQRRGGGWLGNKKRQRCRRDRCKNRSDTIDQKKLQRTASRFARRRAFIIDQSQYNHSDRVTPNCLSRLKLPSPGRELASQLARARALSLSPPDSDANNGTQIERFAPDIIKCACSCHQRRGSFLYEPLFVPRSFFNFPFLQVAGNNRGVRRAS